MSQPIEISYKEIEAFGNENEMFSDICMSHNSETGKYDIHAIEWDGPHGRYWIKYENVEMRDQALDDYQREMNAWVIEYRIRMGKIKRVKNQKAKAIMVAKTLGGQHPILSELKKTMEGRL